MLVILANSSVYDLQRIRDTVLIPDSFVQSVYLFVNRRMSTTLSQFPNILFSSFANSTANCGPLSEITLSGNLYNFYILSLNNLTNSSADISSIVATKCAILDNLLQTTRITSFPATNSNLVIR